MAEPFSLVGDLTQAVNRILKQQQHQQRDTSTNTLLVGRHAQSAAHALNHPVSNPFAAKTDALAIAKTLEDMLDDAQSIRIYTINYFFKEFVLNVLLELITNTNDYHFKKKCYWLLKCFIDCDYDRETLRFASPRPDNVAEIYGRVLCRLAVWGQIGEMILEQSLYSNTGLDEERIDYDTDHSMSVVNEHRDQQRLLALVKYTLKCVDLRMLLRQTSLTKIHYRFLIVNFSLSPQIPRIVEAMTSNFINLTTSRLFTEPPPLLPDSSSLDEKTLLSRINSFYQISLRSNKIFFKENKNSTEILECVMQIHANVSQYIREQYKEMSKSRQVKWRRLLHETVKSYVVDLDCESNAKYRRINYRIVYYMAQVIYIHYDLLSLAHKQKITNTTLLAIRRVLNRLSLNRLRRSIEPDEIRANDKLIQLMSRIIITNKQVLAWKVLGDFQFALIDGIKFKNDLVVREVIHILKHKKEENFTREHADFVRTLIINVKRTLANKPGYIENKGAFLITCCDLTITLVESYVAGKESMNKETEIDAQLVTDLIALVQSVLKPQTNVNFLDYYLEFNIKILRFILNGGIKFETKWQDLALELLEFIYKTDSLSSDASLEEASYISCLKFINLLSCRKKKTKEFMHQYHEVIQETILRVEQNVDMNNERNRKTAEVFQKLKSERFPLQLHMLSETVLKVK